ncbi:MAG: type II toxin-antitoxin system VapC family toxin [Candidatus Kapaibacterium sp.]|nr:type II toxin-antitoxin system VapC family toxin [Bacteroidota bacterium]
MYLLDTNTVIDFCNSRLPHSAKQLLQSIHPNISVITQIELFSTVHIPHSEKIQLEKFVEFSTIFNSINDAIVQETITIRQQHKIKLPDAIIQMPSLRLLQL